jgi:hypothetical protein
VLWVQQWVDASGVPPNAEYESDGGPFAILGTSADCLWGSWWPGDGLYSCELHLQGMLAEGVCWTSVSRH